jgi:hypothetical protein
MTWLHPTAAERDQRDAHILELWSMGLNRREIATLLVDLSPQRVSQILARLREAA